MSVPARLGQRNLQTVLVQALRISPAEATRRVRAQAVVGYRQTMLGETLAPVWPHLAAAQRTGDISAEQVAVVERALDQIDRPGLDPAQVADAEELLADYALSSGRSSCGRSANGSSTTSTPTAPCPTTSSPGTGGTCSSPHSATGRSSSKAG